MFCNPTVDAGGMFIIRINEWLDEPDRYQILSAAPAAATNDAIRVRVSVNYAAGEIGVTIRTELFNSKEMGPLGAEVIHYAMFDIQKKEIVSGHIFLTPDCLTDRPEQFNLKEYDIAMHTRSTAFADVMWTHQLEGMLTDAGIKVDPASPFIQARETLQKVGDVSEIFRDLLGCLYGGEIFLERAGIKPEEDPKAIIEKARGAQNNIVSSLADSLRLWKEYLQKIPTDLPAEIIALNTQVLRDIERMQSEVPTILI